MPYDNLIVSMGAAPVRRSTTHGGDRRHIRDYKMATTPDQGSQTLVTIENIRAAQGAYRCTLIGDGNGQFTLEESLSTGWLGSHP